MTEQLIKAASKDIVDIFKDDITQEGIDALQEKYPLTMKPDMTNDEEFKAGRKNRTERNALIKSINRRRIDKSAEMKTYADNLIEVVTNIYDVICLPFEKESEARKKEEERKAKIEADKLASSKKALEGLRGYCTQARDNASSEAISSMIDAVNNVDVTVFHKDLIADAITLKEEVLADLSVALSNRMEYESSEREKYKIRLENERLEKEQKERELDKKVDDHISWIKSLPGEAIDCEHRHEVQSLIDMLMSSDASQERFGDRFKEVVDAVASSENKLNKFMGTLSDPEPEPEKPQEPEQQQDEEITELDDVHGDPNDPVNEEIREELIEAKETEKSQFDDDIQTMAYSAQTMGCDVNDFCSRVLFNVMKMDCIAVGALQTAIALTIKELHRSKG